ncbi:MAG TPA: putative Ig domain-containing protein [Bryobacteraceae bacterium]|nr:putative Ig domain-containing protein [Bryobacteraceae bacterium]
MAAPLSAQISALTLGSGSGAAGGNTALNLTLTAASGTSLAGLEWTLTYPPTIGALAVTAGPAAASAGKALSCAGANGSYTCLLTGLNSNILPNGIIAVVNIALASGASGTVPIGVSGVLGSSSSGGTLPVSGTGGGISVAGSSAPSTPAVTSLVCSPATLAPGGTASCSVQINQSAPASGASVGLLASNGAIRIPSSVFVPSGASSAGFSAVAGSFTGNQTALVTASLNGSSAAASLSLVGASPSAPPPVPPAPSSVPPPASTGGPPAVSPQSNPLVSLISLSCTPASLASTASTSCKVMLSGPAPAATSVALSSDSSALSFPSTFSIPAGSSTASFTVTAGAVTANQTATVTASWNGISQAASLNLNAKPGTVPSITCTPDLTAAGTLNCTLQLPSAAPASGATVSLHGSTSQLQIPTQMNVPAGAQSTPFAVKIVPSDQDAQLTLNASVNGTTAAVSLSIPGIRPTSLVCPTSIDAGARFDCQITLNSPAIPQVAQLAVSAPGTGLKLPAAITTRPGQSHLGFTVYSDPLAASQGATVAVQFGGTSLTQSVAIRPRTAPVLTVPATQLAAFGQALQFAVSAADPAGLAVILSAANLPSGATFDPASGQFSWTPSDSQQGSYPVTFTATNTASAASSAQVLIQVDSGSPIITDIRNAASQGHPACTPAGVASLVGRWLALVSQPVADPLGSSTQLGGAQVNINGSDAPVLFASAGRVDFVCPNLSPGTALNVSLQNAAGSASVQTTMERQSPGIFSLDGSGAGQGLVVLWGTSSLAANRTYLNIGQPAEPGDSLVIRVTGLGGASLLPLVKFGGIYTRAASLTPAPGMAGVSNVTVTVPPGVPEGDAIPLSVLFPGQRNCRGAACDQQSCTAGKAETVASLPTGACNSQPSSVGFSNVVTIAIEAARF